MANVNDKYKGKNLAFPDTIDPNKKNLKHCIEYAEAIWCKHYNNRCGISYSNQESYRSLRLYGKGEQPEEIYKKLHLGEASGDNLSMAQINNDSTTGGAHAPTGDRKSYMNILWKVISTAPKVKSALIGKFQRAEFNVVANAIDEKSGAEKETKKFGVWFMKENIKFMNEFNKKAGLPMEEMEYVPESLHELEMYDENGGFKPEYCKQIEKVIAHTFDISDFPGIKDKMMEDAIDLAVFCCREYYDEEDKKYKIKYVDPEFSTIQYSKYFDFRDSEYAGEEHDITISELKVRLAEEGVKFKEEDMKKAAESYCGYKNNPDSGDFNDYARKIESTGAYGYDFFKVRVFSCEWIEIDGKQELVHKNRTGRKKVVSQQFGTKNKKNENNKTIITTNRQKYQCSWVVGTEYAYDYGKAFDMLRPTKKSVALSYHFYKLPAKSITDQLIPIYDNFMNLWIKYQNALSKARPQGFAFNTTAIQNIAAATGVAPTEIMRKFLQAGDLFFKETSGMNVRNSVMKPVYDLPSGMGNIFPELQSGFQMNIQMIEMLTGISPLSLGHVDPDAPVGTSEISYQNTQDTLRPILNGYSTIKERASSNVVLWIQMKLDTDESVAEAYMPVIGKNGVQVLKTAEGNNVKYGINIESQPTALETQRIYEAADKALSNGRNGQPGISISQYFSIVRILESGGSLKLAEDLLNSSIAQDKKEMDRLAKENLEIQNQGAQKLEQMKSQKEIAMKVLESNLTIKEEYAKAVFEVMVKNQDTQMRDAEMLELKTYYDMIIKQADQQGQQQATPQPASSGTPQSAI